MWFLIIIIFGGLSRLAGSGFGAKRRVAFLPELAIGLLAGFLCFSGYIIPLLVSAWVYLWFQTGHSDALPIGKQPDNKPLRDNTLTKATNWITNKFKVERDTTPYDLIFLSLKGGLITLPFIPTGLILYPLGWWLGEQSPWKPDICRDLLSGASMGVSIIIYMGVF